MSIKDYAKKVNGKKIGEILMFTLSTCVWCMKTKKLLKDLGVEYSYIDVDLLDEKFLHEVEHEFKHWNPKMSFPTIVINKKNCVVGFREDEIRKLLNEK
jgi:glutaredoxin-like protein NrdH